MLKDYFEAFEKDRDFSSRTGRKEFWHAAIPDIIIIAFITAGIFLFEDFRIIFIIAGCLYIAATFTSRLALWFRRLHDTGLKGSFALVGLIPVVGILALWFVFMSDSQPKNNEYGDFTGQKPKRKTNSKKK